MTIEYSELRHGDLCTFYGVWKAQIRALDGSAFSRLGHGSHEWPQYILIRGIHDQALISGKLVFCYSLAIRREFDILNRFLEIEMMKNHPTSEVYQKSTPIYKPISTMLPRVRKMTYLHQHSQEHWHRGSRLLWRCSCGFQTRMWMTCY